MLTTLIAVDRVAGEKISMTDETQLLKRLLAGEPQAYKELVITYQGAMRAVAYAIVGTHSADDAVQDAWLSVVRNLKGFQGRSSLKAWLLTITANSAKNRYKQNRREVLLDDLLSSQMTTVNDRFSPDTNHWLVTSHEWHQDTPEALLTAEELRKGLERTLLCLSESQRSVLLLRDRHGIALEDICSLLEVKLPYVRLLLHRARLKVFSAVGRFEESGEC